MATLKAFGDDAAAIDIGDLKVENGQDRIAIYGNLDLTRDKTGLKQARDLKALLDEVVRVLEADKSLPERIAQAEKPLMVKNPFE